ncbi:DUF5723 family protein [Saccharicrinis aurantiacus]|uniref:DUF5723 family protein n=1 Tax=Saccharicrinis aurantiacus TaxID=1849719 RepID=UPI000839870F|nr:DUF5723 family protein [Saccharicrinis aurantiacus]
MKLTYILALFLLIGGSYAKSQSSVLYHMKGIPQTKELNPAFFNQTEAIYIGVPMLSGIDMATSTNGWGYNDLIRKGTGVQADSLVMDIDNFYNSLDDNNFLREALNITILEFGFRAGKNFFGLSVGERQYMNTNWDRNLIAPFTTHPDAPKLGEDYTTGKLDVSAMGYHEVTLNYGREINDKLTIGFAAKGLIAYANIQAENISVDMVSSNNGYSIDMVGRGNINFTVPGTVDYENNQINGLDITNDDFINALTGTDNFGLGFDFGADYKINDKIRVSASVIDLGKITFKTNSHKLTENDEGYSFSGIDITKDNDQDIGEDLLDAINFNGEEGKYSVNLPAKVYLGGVYSLNKTFELGALTRLRFINGNTSATYSASANAYIGKFFSLATSYSIIENTYNNLGLGFGIRASGLQIYAGADDVISLANPSQSNNTSFRFGVNFLLNRKFKEKKADLELE